MQEEKENKPVGSSNDEATSDATLKDVEKTEDVAEAPDDKGSPALPSPDGSIDSDTTERNPKDDIGPM